MVEILSEIDEYLDYYDEEIEKSYGVQSIHEWSRIHNEVIRLFIEDIKSEENIKNYEKRLILISKFIKSWLGFEKENVEKLLT